VKGGVRVSRSCVPIAMSVRRLEIPFSLSFSLSLPLLFCFFQSQIVLSLTPADVLVEFVLKGHVGRVAGGRQINAAQHRTHRILAHLGGLRRGNTLEDRREREREREERERRT